MSNTEPKDVFAPGQLVGGYRILRRLGKGGMAEVYEVESEKTGSPYALKVFVCEQANAIFLKKRFLAEGHLLAKLHHPRIVRVYDFGFEGSDETPYYVMDLVLNATGRPCTLRDVLSDGATDEAQIAGWYRDLAEALAYIHGKGIVHRDVSLENVLVGPDGRAVLSDFGVSKVIDRDLRAELNLSLVTQITNGKPLMGKAFYMAPEVCAGGEETFASDLYALGVLLFYMLNQVWYTPGAKVADLLALFDDQWQEILPALLAEDPATRSCRPWIDPRARENAELREECERLRQTMGSPRRRWVRRALLGGVLGAVIGVVLPIAMRHGDKRGVDRMVMYRQMAVKEAEALCLPPVTVRNDDQIDRAIYDLSGQVAVCEISDLIMQKARGLSVDVGSQIEQKAHKYRDIDDDIYQLICCQAAFRIHLREGQLERAAQSLTSVRNLDDKWADALQKEAEDHLRGDTAKLEEFKAKIKKMEEEDDK